MQVLMQGTPLPQLLAEAFKEAIQHPLGIIGLILALIGFLGWRWFDNASEKIKALMFLLLVVGLIGFGIMVIYNANSLTVNNRTDVGKIMYKPDPYSDLAKSYNVGIPSEISSQLIEGKYNLGNTTVKGVPTEHNRFYADVDGNRERDFCRFINSDDSHLECLLIEDGKFTGKIFSLKGDTGYNTNWRWIEDVNGDGKGDYCAYKDVGLIPGKTNQGDARKHCWLAGEKEFMTPPLPVTPDVNDPPATMRAQNHRLKQ